MERNISTAARNGEPRWKSLTREDMKANTVVFTSHAGIKTVDVAEALVTQGYTDVASVQITNSNLTKVTLLSATQTDALLGHGFFIGDSHFSVRPAFTKQLQLHIFDVPIWIENTVICSALAAFGQIQGDIRHGQIQTPSGITVGTGMRFATIELKEGCRQVPSFVRTADQHQFRVRHEDQRATCRICMGEHFARSCPSKRPTNKPPTNIQSTNSAALPGSQLSSGTSAPDAGGSEAVVSASSGSSCTNTDPSAEPESSNQSTSSARTRTEPNGSHSYASAAQQGARAQFNCTHGAAEQVSTAPDGSPTSSTSSKDATQKTAEMNSASASENTTSDGESKEIQSNTPSSADQTEVAESSSLQVIAPSTPPMSGTPPPTGTGAGHDDGATKVASDDADWIPSGPRRRRHSHGHSTMEEKAKADGTWPSPQRKHPKY